MTVRALNASAATDTTFSGNITLAFASNPSGGTLTVTGNASAQLKLVNAADSVNVTGTFTVTALAAAANLTAGTIVEGGNFIQAGNYQSFPSAGGCVTVPRVYFDSSTTPVSGTTPALSAPKVYFDGYYGGSAYLGPKRMALAGTLTANGAFNIPRDVFTAGTIYADSAFIVQGVQASGSHKVVMHGSGSFYFAAGTSSTIDSTASGNWLNDVDLANSVADTLVIGGSVLVKGTLSKSTATPTVFSGTNSLPGVVAVNGINVTQPTAWNRVPLAIVGSGSVALGGATLNWTP